VNSLIERDEGKDNCSVSKPATNVVETSQVFYNKLPLPDGWQWARLGDLCEFVRGVSFDKGEVKMSPTLGHIPILRAGNISKKLDKTNDLIWLPSHNVSQEQRFRAKDIAVCMSSGSPSVVGKTAQLDEPFEGSVGAFCGIIRARSVEHADYLAYWLRSPSYEGWRDSQTRGANIQNLRFSEFASILLPLPPPSELKRITSILKEQMAAVERARAAAEAQLKAAQDLPAAYLRAVFDSPESKQWQRRQLEEVCSISTGTTPDTNRADYYKGEIPFIKTSELLDNRISKSEIYVSQQAANNYRLKPYPVGTVLLAMYGQGKTRGRVGLLDISATTTQNAAALVPNASLDSEFLWLWLRSQYKFLRGIGYQGDLSHLSLGFVKQLEIPVPPLSKQRSIVAALIKELESSEQLYQKTKEQVDAMEHLPAALLRQAFTGKL
jgi:type I restriction enzyme S subunit